MKSKNRRFRLTAMQRAIVRGPWMRMWSPKREEHYFIPDHMYRVAFALRPCPPCGDQFCIGCAGNYNEHKTQQQKDFDADMEARRELWS